MVSGHVMIDCLLMKISETKETQNLLLDSVETSFHKREVKPSKTLNRYAIEDKANGSQAPEAQSWTRKHGLLKTWKN